jgi:Ca2+-binding EF-hand superfamily protein
LFESQNNSLVDLTPGEFLEKLFTKFDFNSSRRISKFDFARIVQTLTRLTGASFPPTTDVDDLFTYLDKDGDQTISFVEFQTLMESFTKIMNSEGFKLKLKKY